ncbi:hypothetical protein [Chitinibacter sp. ZOR0017]|uniref:hypothetical protein n=1 Tax=Chitinibacter sp. ZOR0017 TaxID=1339254 RepID=UPI0006471165|nr:hypothetical protein [Chitinibacter sp. ZOR0017]
MLRRSLCLAVFLLAPTLSWAGAYADDLQRCMVNSTTAADKNALVKWMFVEFAEHPSLAEFRVVEAATKVQIEKNMAVILQRLLVDQCAKQARAAMQNEGMLGYTSAFRALGEAAGMSLMQDPKVAKGMQSFVQYVDLAKVQAALQAPTE